MSCGSLGLEELSPRTSSDALELSPSSVAATTEALGRARRAQGTWRETPLVERLRVIRRVRRAIGDDAGRLAATVDGSLSRVPGETIASEVLPLAAACRFLEREAVGLLAPRRLGMRGRPIWLFGSQAQIRREPFGVVLILSPFNYPLLLPGVQMLQALTAGNAVLVKPAPAGTGPMQALDGLLGEAGLPKGLVHILDETVEAGLACLEAGVDKVILTGSARTGSDLLGRLASTTTPAVMELSGNDAVFVLPGADVSLVAESLAFGLRFNGSATCIAPRRVLARPEVASALEARLTDRIASLPTVTVHASVAARLRALIDEAESAGARIIGDRPSPEGRMQAVIVADASPDLGLLREDVFAPVISLVPVADEREAVAAAARCLYALGASIFGPEREALALAGVINAGSVTINDLIVPTADPRLPFGGRGASGFGTTRGAEGLLEMTTIKTVSSQRSGLRLHLEPPHPDDTALLSAFVAALHGSVGARLRALRTLPKLLTRRMRTADAASLSRRSNTAD